MAEMVEARRIGDKVEQRYDLFSGLLDAGHAAQDELDNGAALNDEELIGRYSKSRPRSFGILGKCLILSPRKYVYLPSCWT